MYNYLLERLKLGSVFGSYLVERRERRKGKGGAREEGMEDRIPMTGHCQGGITRELEREEGVGWEAGKVGERRGYP